MPKKADLLVRLSTAVEANRGNPLLGSMTRLLDDALKALTVKEEAKAEATLATTKALYAQVRTFNERLNLIAREFALAHDERAKHITVKDWNPVYGNETISVAISYEINERDLRDDESLDEDDRYDDRYGSLYAKRSMHLYFEDRWLWTDDWRDEVVRAARLTEIADVEREIERAETSIEGAVEAKASAEARLEAARKRLAKLR